MKILKIREKTLAAIKSVASELKRGAVIVYPTDTAYALGCDATNAKAVRRIFAIKGRTASKGLPIIVADRKLAEKFFLMSLKGGMKSLAKRHWPGPLSLVLKAKKTVAANALENGTAAVRVPDSETARSLSRLLRRPLAATSANISGAPACYSSKAFLRQARAMSALPDLVLDAGALRKRRPSTIARIGKDGRIEVLRKGPIKLRILGD